VASLVFDAFRILYYITQIVSMFRSQTVQLLREDVQVNPLKSHPFEVISLYQSRLSVRFPTFFILSWESRQFSLILVLLYLPCLSLTVVASKFRFLTLTLPFG